MDTVRLNIVSSHGRSKILLFLGFHVIIDLQIFHICTKDFPCLSENDMLDPTFHILKEHAVFRDTDICNEIHSFGESHKCLLIAFYFDNN